MSKHVGNVVNPFEMMDKYGADPVRFYMMTNSEPWDNLKFDPEGVDEVRRKFFGTLYNTYSFFSLYANVDGFNYSEDEVPFAERPEIDRWILSVLHSLIKAVDKELTDYDPTRAGRLIEAFVNDDLSNWFVRLNRKRFWGGGLTEDKLAAYQTLYTCLETVAKLSAPFAPFISDRIYRDLNAVSGRNAEQSVHLSSFPVCDKSLVDTDLELTTAVAQQLSSMVLALRRKVNIKVRQPLAKIIIPVLDAELERRIKAVEALVASEVNVKSVELIHDTAGIITKRIKPNFKTLGPKYGKYMKAIQALVATFDQSQITDVECGNITTLDIAGETIEVTAADFEITSEDMPGWLVASEGKLTVALDITVTPELEREGIARELVNRIQNIRKESGLEIVDKIRVEVEDCELVHDAVAQFAEYICQQTLSVEITCVPTPAGLTIDKYNEVNDTPVKIAIAKI
jgi:isoleucyl-tRNA synthetase